MLACKNRSDLLPCIQIGHIQHTQTHAVQRRSSCGGTASARCPPAPAVQSPAQALRAQPPDLGSHRRGSRMRHPESASNPHQNRARAAAFSYSFAYSGEVSPHRIRTAISGRTAWFSISEAFVRLSYSTVPSCATSVKRSAYTEPNFSSSSPDVIHRRQVAALRHQPPPHVIGQTSVNCQQQQPGRQQQRDKRCEKNAAEYALSHVCSPMR